MQKNLSVFIDESGDFGKYDSRSPYYLVTFLFHDQTSAIDAELFKLETHLSNIGHAKHVLHTGPLIRKEEVYCNISIDERKRLLNAFMNFAAKIPFSYHTILIQKSKSDNLVDLTQKIARAIRSFFDGSDHQFAPYDKRIVYYDNGQIQLTQILASALTDNKTEFRKVPPASYRLFQLADLVTTLELINTKKNANATSRSEVAFFGSMHQFYKDYYKRLIKKSI